MAACPLDAEMSHILAIVHYSWFPLPNHHPDAPVLRAPRQEILRGAADSLEKHCGGEAVPEPSALIGEPALSFLENPLW